MSDFKKGQRVHHPDLKYGRFLGHSANTGLSVVAFEEFGDRWVSTPSIIAAAPAAPRFEDVRTGDQITVEVKPRNDPAYTLAGVAFRFDDGTVTIREACHFFRRSGDDWYAGGLAKLTAHEPDEAWHRAKVIKALADGDSGDGDYFIRTPEGFRDDWRQPFAVSEIQSHSVTVIVDEHGEVQP